MGLHVNNDTLLQTTKCIKHLKCLRGEVHRFCKVRDTVRSGAFVFIEGAEDNSCLYHVKSDAVHICTCPIRAELHSRYDI